MDWNEIQNTLANVASGAGRGMLALETGGLSEYMKQRHENQLAQLQQVLGAQPDEGLNPQQVYQQKMAALAAINNPTAQKMAQDIFTAQLPTPERQVAQQQANTQQQQANTQQYQAKTQAMDVQSLIKYRAQQAAIAQQQTDVEHFKAHNTLPGFENIGEGKLRPNVIVPNPAQDQSQPQSQTAPQQSLDPNAPPLPNTQLKPGVNIPSNNGAQTIPMKLLYPKEASEMENNLRTQYLGLPQVKGLAERTEGYNTFLSTIDNKGGANDLSSLLSFIKLAAPGQAVRQNELQALGDSMGLGDRLDVIKQKLQQGGKLSDNQRSMFKQAANRIYNSAVKQNAKVRDQYTTIAQQKGLDPANIVLDVTSNNPQSQPMQAANGTPPSSAPAPAPSTVAPIRIRNPKTGHSMQLINGQWQ